MKGQSDKQLILAIAYSADKNQYSFDIPQGMSLQEVAFAVSALARCLKRDKVIETEQIFVDLVNKYLNDPQYNEVSYDESDS